MPRLAIGLLLILSTSGCIENMGDLKEALGFVEPIQPASYLAPLARAQATPASAVEGTPIGFVASTSSDPQGLALTYKWAFGDGNTADGPVVAHAYPRAGEYIARVTVTNAAGLVGDDDVNVIVHAADRAPSAEIRVLDASGVPTMRGSMGEAILFESIASDPEGRALRYVWDMGDGTTSPDARVQHTFTAPGIYDITLVVTDPAGQTASAATRVAIDATWRAQGVFEAAGTDTATTPIEVAKGARSLDITLSFDAGAGLNDLEIIVTDAKGAEVTRTAGEGAPGATGTATRTITLTTQDISRAAAGAWQVDIVRERGISVAWTLDIAERV